MKKFVSKEKLSKKARREIDKTKRNTWGPLNPVTRKAQNKMTYNRKKVQLEDKDYFQAEP